MKVEFEVHEAMINSHEVIGFKVIREGDGKHWWRISLRGGGSVAVFLAPEKVADLKAAVDELHSLYSFPAHEPALVAPGTPDGRD